MADLYIEHLKAEIAALSEGIAFYRKLVAENARVQTARHYAELEPLAQAAKSVQDWEDRYGRRLVQPEGVATC